MKGNVNNSMKTLSITTSSIDGNEEVEPAPRHTTDTNTDEPEPETESKTDINLLLATTPERLLPPSKIACLFKAKLQYKPPKQFVKSPAFNKRFVVIDVQVKLLVINDTRWQPHPTPVGTHFVCTRCFNLLFRECNNKK